MRKLSKTIFPILLFFALCFLYSCLKTDPDYNKENKPDKLSFNEAKKFFEENADDLQFLNFHSDSANIATKSILDLSSDIVIKWSQFRSGETNYSYTVEVPLIISWPIAGIIFDAKGHYFSTKKQADVSCILIIEKSKKSGKRRYTIMTTIGKERGNAKQTKYNYFTGNRKTFEGYTIFSTIAGNYICSYQYHNGIRKRVYFSPAEHHKDSIDHELSYKGIYFITGKQWMATKGGLNYTSGEDNICPYCGGSIVNQYCTLCKTYILEPAIIVDDPTLCPNCQELKGNCKCCTSCGQYPCECPEPSEPEDFYCELCGQPNCNGRCQECNDDDKEGGGEEFKPDTLIKYRFSYEVEEGGTVFGTSSGSYESGTQISLTAMANSGYIFVYWRGDEYSPDETISFEISRNTSIKAYFSRHNPIVKNVDKRIRSLVYGALLDMQDTSNCMRNEIYNLMYDKAFNNPNNGISFAVGNTKDYNIAQYWNGTITFKDESAVSEITMSEELVHALQEDYLNITSTEMAKSSLNVEFEAKFLLEMTSNKNIFSEGQSNTGDFSCFENNSYLIKVIRNEAGQLCQEWFHDVKNNKGIQNIASDPGYKFFEKAFSEKTTNYAGKPYNSNYTPVLLQSIFSNSQNNQCIIKKSTK